MVSLGASWKTPFPSIGHDTHGSNADATVDCMATTFDAHTRLPSADHIRQG